MATPVAERVTFLVGGAALGAVSYAAYQKYVQKPRPAAVPVPVPAAAPPAPTAAPGRSLSNIEKAKSILPFGFPGMQSTREGEDFSNKTRLSN